MAKPAFDSDHWQRAIALAIDQITAEDNGGMAWARENHPDLYQRCLDSGKQVDQAFQSQNAARLELVIQEFLTSNREANKSLRSAA